MRDEDLKVEFCFFFFFGFAATRVYYIFVCIMDKRRGWGRVNAERTALARKDRPLRELFSKTLP